MQTKKAPSPGSFLWPGRTSVIVLYLFAAMIILRGLVRNELGDRFSLYLGLEVLFLLLYTLIILKPRLPQAVLHGYFLLQIALIWILVWMYPDYDFSTGFYILLSFQAMTLFPSPLRWIWSGFLLFLTGVTLMFFFDPWRGLALGLINMAVEVVIAAYTLAYHQNEFAQRQSETVLQELQQTHQQLQFYASQVEELAAIEERNRLARELHDSVSQTLFSIILNARSTQVLMERDPSRLQPQLELLQKLSQDALVEMRSLIAELRPK